jgi:Flp pilus assembly protein TadG
VSRRPPRDPARPERRRVARLRRCAGVLRRRGPADDRGVSAIELVMFMPLLFLAIFAIVQFGLVFLGNSAVSSAARETARIVRSGGTEADARARGDEILGTIGRGLYDDSEPTSIEITRPAADEIRVTVRAKGVSVVPGLPSPTLEQVVQGPVEQFRGDL